MKLNNKGFAITAVLYGLLILFVVLVGSYLTVLSVRKSRTDNLINDMEEDYLENVPDNGQGTNNPGEGTNNTGNNNEPETRTICTVTLSSGTFKTVGTEVLYFVIEENKWYLDVDATRETTSITNPTKDNYTFNGYYTRSNGSGTLIINSAGTIVSNAGNYITGDTTLYAYWVSNGGGGGLATA